MKIGNEHVHQRGSHLKLVTYRLGKHIALIPQHRDIPLGTLHKILRGVAHHHALSLDELLNELNL